MRSNEVQVERGHTMEILYYLHVHGDMYKLFKKNNYNPFHQLH